MKENMSKGYIALIVVLVISVLVVTIGMTTSALSINDLQSSYAGMKNEKALAILESCVEDALLQLNENASISSTITLPDGSCSVIINSQTGESWDFSVSVVLDNYFKKVRVEAIKTTTVAVTGWKEIN